MSCYLWVAGKYFDIDGFLEKTKLEVDRVGYKGKPRYKSHPDKLIARHNSLQVKVSDVGFDEFNMQVQDAVKYLTDNFKKLDYIKSIDTIEYANLRFGMNSTPDKPIQSIYYPPELIKLCGELGLSLEVSIYNTDFFETGEEEVEV